MGRKRNVLIISNLKNKLGSLNGQNSQRVIGRSRVQFSGDSTFVFSARHYCTRADVSGTRGCGTARRLFGGLEIVEVTALSLKAELHVPYLVKRHGVKPP